jgi:hypothetical protein
VFTANARTGSTSMLVALDAATGGGLDSIHRRLSALPFEYHMGIEDILREHPTSKDYFKFCFVRNPWARFLSAYEEFRDPGHHGWSKELLAYDTFEDFCLGFNDTEIKDEIHFVPLSKQVCINGELVMDYVARFENYEQEFRKIFNLTHLNLGAIPHERKAINEQNYTQEYTNKTRQLIGDFYKSDLEMFGYKWGQ